MSANSEFIKLNTSIYTGSNAGTLERDSEGNIKSVIEMRLPDSLSDAKNVTSIDLQVNKMTLSLYNVPVAFVPIDVEAVETYRRTYGDYPGTIPTTMWVSVWPYYIRDDGSIRPEEAWSSYLPKKYPMQLHIPTTYETFDLSYAMRTGRLPILHFETLAIAIEQALTQSFNKSMGASSTNSLIIIKVQLSSDSFSITWKPVNFENSSMAYLFGTPGIFAKPYTGDLRNAVFCCKQYIEIASGTITKAFPQLHNVTGKPSNVPWGLNIVANKSFRDVINFLPWIKPVPYRSLASYEKFTDAEWGWVDQKYRYPESGSDNLYVIDSLAAEVSTFWPPTWDIKGDLVQNPQYAYQFLNAKYVWHNVPTILISPVSSIVLLIDGMGVSPQVMPINIQQAQGSSLTTSVPVIENYFPMTSTLRDLHDVLVVYREAFTNTPLFSVPPDSMRERTLRFRAGYITKDGELFDLYIPPTGTFSLNLVFCLHHKKEENEREGLKRPRIA